MLSFTLLLQDHPDFENLNKALNMIVETANFVNQKKMEAENIQKCMAIQATLYGKNIEVEYISSSSQRISLVGKTDAACLFPYWRVVSCFPSTIRACSIRTDGS